MPLGHMPKRVIRRPMRKTLWHRHPGVRTGALLSPGERAADVMRNGMGSWPFVGVFAVVLLTWVVGNTVILTKVLHHNAFDPYPYILLNLFLSMLAAIQGAIILIAQKRADQVASEEAHHTLANTELLKDLVQQNTTITEGIHELASKISGHLDVQ